MGLRVLLRFVHFGGLISDKDVSTRRESALMSCDGKNVPHTITSEATDCNAAEERCLVAVDELVVSLRLQAGVEALKPFSLSVEIENAGSINEVIIDFQMVGMEMGPNRYRLLDDGASWQGQATLPVCASSGADWLAVVEFPHGGRHYRIAYPFTSR